MVCVISSTVQAWERGCDAGRVCFLDLRARGCRAGRAAVHSALGLTALERDSCDLGYRGSAGGREEVSSL